MGVLSLLKSRKFWVIVIPVIATFLEDQLGLDPQEATRILWCGVALAGFIAVEDAAEKLNERSK